MRPRRLQLHLAIAWLVMALLATGPNVRGADCATVAVEFKLNDPDYANNMQAHLADLRLAVVTALRTVDSAWFPFVRWVDAASEPSSGATKQKLQLSLERSSAENHDMVLQFTGSTGSADFNLGGFSRVVMYKWFDLNQPNSDHERLATDLRDTLESLYANDGWRTSFQSAFVRLLRVADTICPDDLLEEVMIPFRCGGAWFGQDTRLRAEWQVAVDTGGHSHRVALLDLKVPTPGRGDTVACDVTAFRCPPDRLPPDQYWHPGITPAVHRQVSGTLSVSVVDFKFCPYSTTSDGLISNFGEH